MSTTRFDIANAGLEEVKRRVNTWLTTAEALDYYLEKIDDRHVKVIKSKQDTKYCVYGCVGLCATMLLGIVAAITFAAYMGPAGVLFAVIVILVGAFTCMPISYGYFFLKPNKVEYALTASGEYPVHIAVTASGNLLPQCEHEYNSFLNALSPGHPDAGPGIAF
ncbi:MAG: hypothetical protein C4K48_04550 [Candidatus Thorarchaeota archaeon]|nr:MAG: hypothetical protein C4K48_04550 [Candidatus Thorarchaeota archaeon]